MTSVARGPIGVFDSGVGGISVLNAIRRILPGEDLIYVADSAHLPYGEKPRAYIEARAQRLAAFFLEQGVKAIAIPCNTATAAAVDALRRRYPELPIVGIEPAVKPAAKLTRSGVIGVLATTGTLASERFRGLVEREAPGIEVLLKPCPGWVALAEEGWTPERDHIVAEPLSELLGKGADVLVLGCTHFPFLIEPIRRHAGDGVVVLETGEPFARQLHRQLVVRGLARESAGGMGTVRYLASGAAGEAARRIARLSGQAVEVRQLPPAYC